MSEGLSSTGRTFWEPLLTLALLVAGSTARAQEALPTQLPFVIAEEKRLSEEDLAQKKEGVFVTGVPAVGFDPLDGYGGGAEVYITFNGTRSDPFFAYTPYRRRIEAGAYVTSNLTREFRVALDEPYLFDSKWRLRAEAIYEVNPNQLYFGTTTDSLRELGQQLPDASPYAGRSIGSYSKYANRLATVRAGGLGEAARVADNFYNYYTKDRKALNLSMEHAFFDGRLRLVGGFELGFLSIGHADGRRVEARDPLTGRMTKVRNGRTLLTEDRDAGRIDGSKGGRLTLLQTGLVYDTRDLEPDPSRGIFAEITNEVSTVGLGSQFNFDKLFMQAKFYYPLLPKYFSKLVLAARLGMNNTFGDAPFFEYADSWGTEGSFEGLGGFNTMRGYKAARFTARTMLFGNLELRYRFAQVSFWDQTFGFMILPFFDFGGVWNKVRELNFANMRHSEGIGARIAWDQTTIISLDYGFSREDQQFFLELNHAF